jgi:5-methylcytosine-specific restriction endonuclease McrA
LSPKAKSSRRARQKRAFLRRREYAFTYLGNCCFECGLTTGLQVDHVNPLTKKFDILGSRWSTKFEDWKVELEKCQLLCTIHHAEKTRQWYSEKSVRLKAYSETLAETPF